MSASFRDGLTTATLFFFSPKPLPIEVGDGRRQIVITIPRQDSGERQGGPYREAGVFSKSSTQTSDNLRLKKLGQRKYKQRSKCGDGADYRRIDLHHEQGVALRPMRIDVNEIDEQQLYNVRHAEDDCDEQRYPQKALMMIAVLLTGVWLLPCSEPDN